MHSVKNNLHCRLDDLFHHHALSSSRYHLLVYRNILYLLAEAPGVASGIFKNRILKEILAFVSPRARMGSLKKMSALSVQPFGQI